MEKLIIKKSIKINAPTSKVWNVLVNPHFTKLWGSVFSEGAWVDTDWNQGSEVLWKDKAGNIGAKGIVVQNSENKLLRVRFFDDTQMSSPSSLGEYIETYELSDEDGKTTMNIDAGPLKVDEGKLMEPLWDNAVLKMKELAEMP